MIKRLAVLTLTVLACLLVWAALIWSTYTLINL